MILRSVVRIVAFAAFVLGLVWVVTVVITGGFSVPIGGRTLTSHEPLRPLYWTTLPLLIFVWAHGVEKTARAWSSWIAWIIRPVGHRIAIALLTLGTLIVGITFASTVGVGSDGYGYMSEADLWLKGDLHIPQPWVVNAPWPDAARTFAPLAYRPAGAGEPTDIVPVYSPGLPLLMAGAKRLAGHEVMFWVVPITGAMLVLTTFGIGRRLGSPGAGLLAASFVASSPAFWFMNEVPMSDVPAAAFWALCFYLLLRPGAASGALAGLAAGVAILIRPNLVWLAALPGLWLLRHALKGSRDSRDAALSRAFGFPIGVVLAALTIGIVNARLYGSPFQSGYGDLGSLFAFSNIAQNVRIYLGWLVESQTPLILVGVAAAVWPSRRIWPGANDRTFFWMTASCVAGLFAFYFLYIPFGEWWFLRFLLIAWPFIMLGLAAVIIAVARSGPTAFVVCTWIVILLSVRQCYDTRGRGAFELWEADSEFVAAAQATRDVTPETSVILSAMHSGTVRYYGGRMTLLYMWLDSAWLDRTVKYLTEHDAPPYVLLRQEEVDVFKTRFKGAATLRCLDAPPVLVNPNSGLALYSLAAPWMGYTQKLKYKPTQLRSVPPVGPFPFALR